MLDFDPKDYEVPHDDAAWLIAQVTELTDEREVIKVSEWAERKRYLPPQVTPIPGPYSYNITPYLKEIADCFSIASPVREVDVMKGAQIGATSGVLENVIGYAIDHVKTAPVMLLTADDGLAKTRVEQYIIPMLEHSDLNHLIQSNDTGNRRKSGKTSKKIEWVGGGFLIPYGAQNADKLRMISIRILLQDEVDAFKLKVGNDGSPVKLAEARTRAYNESRKIGRISTPLVLATSVINKGYLKGDQRKWHVPCKKCGHEQELRFKHVDKETGAVSGLVWDMDEDGIFVPQSTRFLCIECQHPHRNADKGWMHARGKWVATAKPVSPDRRSYHISALMSPVGMFSWDACVLKWLDAWDVNNNRIRDVGAFQEFYNNILGVPFEVQGAKVSFSQVSAHRRLVYKLGEIPNEYAAQHSGSNILFLTCQVDVHKRNLAVSVMGWCRDSRPYVIDYWRFTAEDDDPDCDELSSPVWGRLRELIEETEYTADDGKRYRIIMTLIDSAYSNATVVKFCDSYSNGVYPILGRKRPPTAATIREFSEFKTQTGSTGYRITVDHYKDRMAAVMRRDWVKDMGMQAEFHFNAPVDITDKQLKELTVEVRREETDEKTGDVKYVWHRPGNARNELWDLLGYGYAAVEIMAWQICIVHFEMESIDWPAFWDYVQFENPFYVAE